MRWEGGVLGQLDEEVGLWLLGAERFFAGEAGSESGTEDCQYFPKAPGSSWLGITRDETASAIRVLDTGLQTMK